jgi:hypothetical protein
VGYVKEIEAQERQETQSMLSFCLVHNGHLMSSLRLALQWSLQESYAPKTATDTATPVQCKKAAVWIITPEKGKCHCCCRSKKKEDWAASTRQATTSFKCNFSSVPTLAEIAINLQVPEKSLSCIELCKYGSLCTVDRCNYLVAERNGISGKK